MADEVHESEFFNQDFTTATRWEVFNARLEEIIHEWKLPFKSFTGERLTANQLSDCEWDTKEEQISYEGINFRITQYCVRPPTPDDDKSDDDLTDSVASASIEADAPKKVKTEQSQCQAFVDLMALENNWCTLDERSHLTIHPLARWYGLRQFIVVSASEATKLTENQRRMLLSSIHIAIGETSCEIPIFVQALRHQQHVYSGECCELRSSVALNITKHVRSSFSGVCEFENTRVSFDIVHLAHTHPSCKYLSGLLAMFKEKMPYDYKDPVTVSVRFTFNLKQFSSAAFVSKRKFAFGDHTDEAAANVVDGKAVLPFGVSLDPVRELVLYCTWPEVAENVVMDSSTYTDFDPLLAPIWSFRMHYEAIPICFMSECIHELLHQCDAVKSVSDILGMEYVYATNADYATQEEVNPLERLTESKISKMLSVALSSTSASSTSKKLPKKAKGIEGPLKDEQLMAMLYYLFPDAQENSPHTYNIPTVDTVSQSTPFASNSSTYHVIPNISV